MPTLSSSTAAELHKRLDAARDDVVAQIRTRLEGSDEPAAVSLLAHLGQPDDVSQAANIRDDEMALLGQEQSLLHAIDSARARLDEGVGNLCNICGGEIPDERLLALPTAQTCVACQQQLEAEAQTPRAPTM
ncbi:MAG TPA: TraR/DksA family transcriptional regulator [Duganella sp.]|jgi:RNA polymerase-binding transcription factor DksA